MHSINALELPEVAHVIAGYLRNLEPCLTVCKAWRYLYLPYYWREVKTGVQMGGKRFTPFFDSIRHAHYRKFVQVLEVYNDYGPIHQSLDYPNLRVLRLHLDRADHWAKLDENPVLKDFVNRHLLLECLDVKNIPYYVMDSTWTALIGHPCLREVIVRFRNSFPDDFWRVCTQLRALEFQYLIHLGPWRIPKDLVLPSICRLELHTLYTLEGMEMLDIISACPLLEDLVWRRGVSSDYPRWSRFGQLATQGTWPHLQQLSVDSGGNDADLSQVIASMHQATKIKIIVKSFGPLSFAALQRHASTLQHLTIPRAMDSRMIRDVLCTFPRLEYLKSKRLDAKDIAEGGPWVCTSLKEMSVEISFSSEEDHLQPVVFERMSRLVHLEKFDNRFDDSLQATHGLIFRLQSGMGALASLTRLRCMWWDPNVQGMDIDDARWIIDHWKRLEIICGQLSQDRSMQEQLEVLFSTSGIGLQKPSGS